MITNRTFTMIKPDAVASGYTGNILAMITNAGFRIVSMKLTQLSINEAQKFYSIHSNKPFFSSLVNFMSSGPIVVAILEKENAIEDFRNLIGSTNPLEATQGTIRKIYAKSLEKNAIHGADSNENAAIESAFYFSNREQY